MTDEQIKELADKIWPDFFEGTPDMSRKAVEDYTPVHEPLWATWLRLRNRGNQHDRKKDRLKWRRLLRHKKLPEPVAAVKWSPGGRRDMRRPGDILPNQFPTVEPPETVWYRFEDVQYAGPCDEFGNSCGQGQLRVERRDYAVTGVTAKGVWLRYGFSRRFCKRDTKKRFACPTEAEALESFRKRKERQRNILKMQLQRVEEALKLCGKQEIQ